MTDESITLKVKTLSETHELCIKQNAAILELKQLILPKLTGTPTIEQLCIIFSGQILKDQDILSSIGLQDGYTVHLVIRSKPQRPVDNSQPTASNEAPRVGGPNLPNPNRPNVDLEALLGEVRNLTMTDTGLEVTLDPRVFDDILNSGILDELTRNPTALRDIIRDSEAMLLRNPQMRTQMHSSPIFQQLLGNIRNTGGFQPPTAVGQNVAGDRFATRSSDPADNPFAALLQGGTTPVGSSSAGVSNQQQTFPNAWAPRESRNSSQNQREQTSNSGTASFESLLNNPQLQSLFGAVQGNSELMREIQSPEQMLGTIRGLLQNPEPLVESTISMTGMRPNTPEERERVRQQVVSKLRLMESEYVAAAAGGDPAVTRALRQIEEAVQVLRQRAPHLLPSVVQQITNAAATSSQRQSERPPENNQPEPSIEERYRLQLETLESMGFTNRAANIEALRAASGNATVAVELLLRH